MKLSLDGVDPPATNKPTIPAKPETWQQIEVLAKHYELDKRIIAGRVFQWFFSQDTEIQEPILRSFDSARLGDFARLILQRMADGQGEDLADTHHEAAKNHVPQDGRGEKDRPAGSAA